MTASVHCALEAYLLDAAAVAGHKYGIEDRVNSEVTRSEAVRALDLGEEILHLEPVTCVPCVIPVYTDL